MELFKRETHIDFMGTRTLALVLSGILIAASIFALATRGLNLGIDFTGGVLIEVGYPQSVELSEVLDVLEAGGFDKAVVQHFGTSHEVLVRLPPEEGREGGEVRDQIESELKKTEPGIEMRRVEFVGPQVGEDLTEQGGLAMLFALMMIMAYIAFRFQWKFSIGAVAALVHDVIITLGVFSFTQLPFDLSVLASILAVIGYSLNDTIVVFDRIRENFLKMRRASPVEVINASVNQMLPRTLITSFTTLLVLFSLYFLGGEALVPFSIALIIGIVVGTYSSIYIASAAALLLNVSTRDLLPPQRDDSEAGAIR